jgi:hypothetical protein
LRRIVYPIGPALHTAAERRILERSHENIVYLLFIVNLRDMYASSAAHHLPPQ